MNAIILTAIVAMINLTAFGQAVTLPPSGDNNQCIVTQYIGALVKVTVSYHSPNVTGPAGEDRKGKIWGQLVPYGFNNLGFGTAKESPWRAGANENTTITFSHDVMVQDKPLKAGTYGFFIVAQKDGPWTLIFSNNSTSWGSFFYDPKEDALRVTTTPQEAPFHEWLTYEFTDRETDHATCALIWETKMIPFTIKVPNEKELYVQNLRKELQNSQGFSWNGWNDAANYCVQNKMNLDEALVWANKSINEPGIGEENFNTLSTKAQIFDALGKPDSAAKVMQKAINSPTATVFQIHQYGRQLLGQGKKDEALKAFQLNAKMHPNQWPVNVGLARGYSATGDYKNALKYAKLAYDQAPDPGNKNMLSGAIEKLQKGQDMN